MSMLLTVVLVVAWVVPARAGEKAPPLAHDVRYLLMHDRIENRLRERPGDKDAHRLKRRLDGGLRRLRKLGGRPSDRYYLHGVRAWRRGDTSAARDAWKRYLASVRWEGLEGEKARLRREEVASYLRATEPPAATPVSPPVAAPVKSPDRPPARKRARRKRPAVRQRPPRSSASSVYEKAAELERRATEAREAGQLENAARLFRLALRLNPASTTLRSGLASVEAEMR